VVRTPWAEGLPIDVEAVEQALRDDTRREIVAVFAVHTDTASGVTSDLRCAARALDAGDHPALFVVDVVASLGVVPFDMDALRADVVLGASQKGLMLPPGLAFVAVNERACASAAANPAPRFYWDWGRRRDSLSYRKFCGTPPMNLLFGLQAALELHRRRRAGRGVRAPPAAGRRGACRGAGLERRRCAELLLPQPAGVPFGDRRGGAPGRRPRGAAHGGARALPGRRCPAAWARWPAASSASATWATSMSAMVLGALAGVEAALRAQGIPIGSGGVQCAVDALARA
jgi:alanine-glyoxylate transaminase / serine-glyoxylate transaminase / serine-pyruvate transaminase